MSVGTKTVPLWLRFVPRKRVCRPCRLYGVWRAIINRCGNPRVDKYRYYGGRGICVCPEWEDYSNFRKWAVSHGYAKGLQIDRINNDGNYEPGNCRWATRLVQIGNRGLPTYTFGGETLSVAGWARKLGMSHHGIDRRLRDWPLEKALTQPKRVWPSRLKQQPLSPRNQRQ